MRPVLAASENLREHLREHLRADLRARLRFSGVRAVGAGLACLVLLCAAPLAGQERSANPHGPLQNECTDCHSNEGWSPLKSPLPYRHAATGFELAGRHAGVACKLCHATLEFAREKGKSDCFACHQEEFTGARNPIHAGFATSCQDCHGVTAWQPATFDHNQTGFQLLGVHRTVECTLCHRTGYSGTPVECISCHQNDFTRARNPVHAGFPNTCRECHGFTAWQPALFDHDNSGFPLSGAHRTTSCVDCHRTGYAGTPTDCFACHQSAFNGASNPSHSGFPTTCQDCHGFSAWQPANFDHNSTGFQLSGAHRSVACTSCHRNGYAGTSADCFGCHQSQYTAARNPDHTGFPTTCQNCHSATSWQPASFDHNSTGFQLAGAHRSVACTSCHRNGYAGTPSDCLSCHQSDFNGASNPSHSGFPTSCQNCHSVTAWQPASFDHNSTGFQLTGAHRTLACTTCHRNGYSGTPSDCFACHQSDFNGTRNPNHASAGFGTNCAECHGTNGWTPATFNHESSFPIASGRHQFPCTSCHVAAGNYNVFECVLCHEHSQGETNPEHRGVGGYVYESRACYQCHPRGRE